MHSCSMIVIPSSHLFTSSLLTGFLSEFRFILICFILTYSPSCPSLSLYYLYHVILFSFYYYFFFCCPFLFTKAFLPKQPAASPLCPPPPAAFGCLPKIANGQHERIYPLQRTPLFSKSLSLSLFLKTLYPLYS